MLQIGIIGSGFMASTHAERYQAIDGVSVAAVVSPTTADQFVRDHHLDATSFASIDAFLDETSLDAVSICSPTSTHKDIIQRLAGQGIDMICEKPLTTTLSDAYEIVDLINSSRSRFMTGHVLRFFPDYRRVYERVEAGAIGMPGTVRACRHSPFPDWGDGWFADDEQSGGVFLDLGIHEFDYLYWLFGDVERVFARHRRWDNRQNGHTILTFENGTVGYVESGWDQIPGEELWSTLELAGDDGLIEYDSREPTPISVTTETDVGSESIGTTAKDGYQLELEAFVDSLKQGITPPVTINDAIKAMEISIAARRSAERNEPVDIVEVKA